ncbi:hypothetical protein [Hyalangium minutum]|nr:hypothetical protein [Hyalangium minutum]
MQRSILSWQGFSVLAAAITLECTPSGVIRPDEETQDPDIVRPSSRESRLETLPGPMLGPFDSYTTALETACEHFLKKPHSSAGRKPPSTALREEQVAFELRWRVSKEYCAWMYYTPDGKYKISKLTDVTKSNAFGKKVNCLIPSKVEDRDYPSDSIKYVFLLHSHPYDTPISEDDILFLEREGERHGFDPETQDRKKLRISIVAFFSHDDGAPACDGFYIYSAQTTRIFKWTRTQGHLACEQTHVVDWRDYDNFDLSITSSVAPCPGKGTP